MKRYKTEEHVDMTGRLAQLEQLLAPRLVAPRTAADEEIEPGPPPLLAVERRLGRMYVAGHEPHFRAVTLLQPLRSARRSGSDPA
jgi:hypothetical protein